MLLRVVAPHFVAGAEWEKRGGVWVCVRAAPIIRWMVGKTGAEIKKYLARRGWEWEWI